MPTFLRSVNLESLTLMCTLPTCGGSVVYASIQDLCLQHVQTAIANSQYLVHGPIAIAIAQTRALPSSTKMTAGRVKNIETVQ